MASALVSAGVAASDSSCCDHGSRMPDLRGVGVIGSSPLLGGACWRCAPSYPAPHATPEATEVLPVRAAVVPLGWLPSALVIQLLSAFGIDPAWRGPAVILLIVIVALITEPIPAAAVGLIGTAFIAVTGLVFSAAQHADPTFKVPAEAIKWADIWWNEDAGEEADAKKLASKGKRAAAARFLDELMVAARARWMNDPASYAQGAARLDQMRRAREYILRNANLQLTLDVMFGRLISARFKR